MLHAEERERGRPADEQEPIKGFHTGQHPEISDRINVAEAKGTERLRRKVKIVRSSNDARALETAEMNNVFSKPKPQPVNADLRDVDQENAKDDQHHLAAARYRDRQLQAAR